MRTSPYDYIHCQGCMNVCTFCSLLEQTLLLFLRTVQAWPPNSGVCDWIRTETIWQNLQAAQSVTDWLRELHTLNEQFTDSVIAYAQGSKNGQIFIITSSVEHSGIDLADMLPCMCSDTTGSAVEPPKPALSSHTSYWHKTRAMSIQYNQQEIEGTSTHSTTCTDSLSLNNERCDNKNNVEAKETNHITSIMAHQNPRKSPQNTARLKARRNMLVHTW